MTDVIAPRRFPAMTLLLVVAHAAVFLYALQLGPAGAQALVGRFGVTPADFSWPATLTALALHSGWLPFVANAGALWLFGPNVEGALHRGPFLLFFAGCGVAAALVHAAARPASIAPLAGASGAVAGVLGAYFVLYPTSRILTAIVTIAYNDLVEVPAVFFVGIWMLLQLAGDTGSIVILAADGAQTLWAIGAGFAAGALYGAYARIRVGVLRRYWATPNS